MACVYIGGYGCTSYKKKSEGSYKVRRFVSPKVRESEVSLVGRFVS